VVAVVDTSVTDSQKVDVILFRGTRHDVVQDNLIGRVVRILLLEDDKVGIASKMLYYV
jgi:hypothetical protein